MSWSTPPTWRSYPYRGDYLKFLRKKLAYCGHLLAEDFVFWCAGADQDMPIAGMYYGAAGFQDFLDRFFAILSRPKLRPFLPTYTLAGNEVVARYEEHTAINGLETPPVWIVNISKF